MTKREDPHKTGRRGFLKLAAAGAPLAAVTAATGGQARAEADTEAPKATGLRKTAHVEAYLKSARF